jgi:uncharacterized tellurite resistance protein B-like protein
MAIELLKHRYPKDKEVSDLIKALQSARYVKIDNYQDNEELIEQLERAARKADSSLLEVAYLRIRRLIQNDSQAT